ncbi:MAG: hypothetical protein WKG01_21365 [Kofleriaceae bacterium]
MDTDLLDHRGRLVRIALALAIGLGVAVVVFGWIASVNRAPNPDPISQLGVGVVAAAIFVGSAKLAHAILTALSRRIRGRVV